MMIIKRLASLFRPRTTQRDFYFYVQCQHCEEVLRGRVDLYNDLSVEYDPLPEAMAYYSEAISLPMFHHITPAQQAQVIAAVADVIGSKA